MARSRNLKPGFFKNEALAECQPLARILFQGLWCIADRDGRLEDRPKRIKAEVLPYDDVDVVALLAELEQGGFITRYTVAGNDYIAVPKFSLHQNPHHREAASVIPVPGQGKAQSEQAQDEPEASPGQAQDLPQPSPELAVLIPSYLLPITDSVQEQPPAADEVVAKESKTKDADLFPGVSKEVIRDFKAVRRSKKAAITATAMDEIKREAAIAGLTLHDALVMCCARGWAGFEASWLAGGGGRRAAVTEPLRLPRLTA